MNTGEISPPTHNSINKIDSGHRIVFFIRARFHESVMLHIGQEKVISPNECLDYFDKYSNIPMLEYRKKVHEIQIECLKKISNRFIYNTADKDLDSRWRVPYVRIQNKAREEILALADDDIIIPLDDDDWLSPEIKFLDFRPNHLTIWNTFSLDVNSQYQFFHIKNEILPMELDDENIIRAKGFLSNCGAYCAKVVKQVINFDVKKANQLLLRHILPRIIIREEPYKLWGIEEKIYEDYLGVYVRHAGNITSFLKRDITDIDNSEFYKKNIEIYKSKKYSPAEELAPEYAWCREYYKKLENLNQML